MSLYRLLSIVPAKIFLFVAISSVPVFSHVAVDEQIRDVSLQLEKAPYSADLYVRRGELYRIHEEWDKALTDFFHAKKLDKAHETVDIFLGKAYLDTERPAKAKGILDQFLKRRPNHVTARILRATAQEKLGDFRAAAADYNHAILSCRGSAKPQPYFFINRAKALMIASESLIDEAIAGLDEGLAILGRVASIQMYAVELELQSTNYDGALRRLNSMASWYGQSPELLIRIAEVSKTAGRFDEARQACSKAITLIENSPKRRRNHKGVIQLRKRINKCINEITGKKDTNG